MTVMLARLIIMTRAELTQRDTTEMLDQMLSQLVFAININILQSQNAFILFLNFALAPSNLLTVYVVSFDYQPNRY